MSNETSPKCEIGPVEKGQLEVSDYDAEKTATSNATAVLLDGHWLKKLLRKIDRK
jgi:hypothetical protein